MRPRDLVDAPLRASAGRWHRHQHLVRGPVGATSVDTAQRRLLGSIAVTALGHVVS